MTLATHVQLESARRLISNPANWTQGTLERAVGSCGNGQPIKVHVSYCAVGALNHVGGSEKAHHILERAAYKLYKTDALSVNDTYDHAAVMRVYDRAIAMAQPSWLANLIARFKAPS